MTYLKHNMCLIKYVCQFLSRVEVCGGILRGTSGVIQSPNYPHFYPKNQTCEWWIIGPADHTLKLQFRDIHLPGIRLCDYSDHVTIAEKLVDNDTRK